VVAVGRDKAGAIELLRNSFGPPIQASACRTCQLQHGSCFSHYTYPVQALGFRQRIQLYWPLALFKQAESLMMLFEQPAFNAILAQARLDQLDYRSDKG
jgi:hypothetical protein